MTKINRDFILTVCIPEGHVAIKDFNYPWYGSKKYYKLDGSLIIVYEGPYRPLVYLAAVAKRTYQIPEVHLEYQGEFSSNPRRGGKYLVSQQESN